MRKNFFDFPGETIVRALTTSNSFAIFSTKEE